MLLGNSPTTQVTAPMITMDSLSLLDKAILGPIEIWWEDMQFKWTTGELLSSGRGEVGYTDWGRCHPTTGPTESHPTPFRQFPNEGG